MPSPIALFVYNRPKHTRLTIEALSKNALARESDLIIFSDGPRNEIDSSKVQQVRDYIRGVGFFKSVKVVESSVNKGLAKSIIAGVTGVLADHDSIVVLEDDMVTSPYFLSFMNQALNMYWSEENVISIHAYMYPVKGKLPDSFFVRGADCWGWATWKRGWDLFESDGSKLLEQITAQHLAEYFDYNNSYPFTQMLRDQINGKNDSWAIRWQASAFLKNKLTLYPGKSYIRNIGFDDTGTHSGITNVFDTKVQTEQVELQKVEVRERLEVRSWFEQYFNSIKPTLMRRINRNLLSLVVKMKAMMRINLR